MPLYDDYGSSYWSSGWIYPGSSVTGNIETGDDTDWFEVWLEAGQEYTFDLEGSPTGGGTLIDTYLNLRDDWGDVILSNDDGGESWNSRITFTPEDSGYFYLDAGSFGSNTGTYMLSVATNGDTTFDLDM